MSDDLLRPVRARIEGFHAGVKAAAAEADKFAAQCLATVPRDQGIYDMGIGAERAAVAIRRLLEQ